MRLAPALLLALAASTVPSAGRADQVLTVTAGTLLPEVVPGGFGEVTCTITNHAPAEVRVFLEGHLRFPGAGRERVLGPTVLEIPAGLSLEIAPLFLVPDDAEPGPAAFTCRAHVAGPLPATERAGARAEERRGEASVPFEVR